MDLVTGGTGVVGSHLLFWLTEKGNGVRALKRASSDTGLVERLFLHYDPDNGQDRFRAIEWVDGDVLDIPSLEDALEGISGVYHAAAFVSFVPKEAPWIERINVQGTANLMNVCLDKGVERVVHVSSVATIGKHGPMPYTESRQWVMNKMETPYSISKHSAEREVHRAQEEGLSTVIANPGIVIGPGDWNRGSLSIFKKVHGGLRFYTEGCTGMVDARDVARGVQALMECDVEGDRFILIGGNHEFKELFKGIARELDVPAPALKASPWMGEVMWRLYWFAGLFNKKMPLITKQTARAAQQRLSFSNERARERLGLGFFSLDEAVRNASAFFRRECIGKSEASRKSSPFSPQKEKEERVHGVA